MRKVLLVALVLLASCRGSASEDARTIPKAVELTANVVTASGRWVTDHKSVGPLLARVNTVHVVCRREALSCTEALATLVTSKDEPRLKGELLLSYLNEYRVEAWTDSSIRAKLEQPVADVTLEIDLVNSELKRTHQETKARGSATANPDRIITWELR